MGRTEAACIKKAGGLLAIFVATAAVVVVELPHDPAARPASAAIQDFSAAQRYIFVPSRSTTAVAVIEKDGDKVVGIESGVVPVQVIASESVGKLVTIDASSRRISIVDLKSGAKNGVDLNFVPQRLLNSADGNLVAAADLAGGTVAFIELVREREVSRIAGLPAIRDLLFAPMEHSCT